MVDKIKAFFFPIRVEIFATIGIIRKAVAAALTVLNHGGQVPAAVILPSNK